MKPTVRQLREVLKNLANFEMDGSMCWCPDGPGFGIHEAGCAEARALLNQGPPVRRAPDPQQPELFREAT
jgi:hypothetical protein